MTLSLKGVVHYYPIWWRQAGLQIFTSSRPALPSNITRLYRHTAFLFVKRNGCYQRILYHTLQIAKTFSEKFFNSRIGNVSRQAIRINFKSALLCNITQHRVVVPYRRFGMPKMQRIPIFRSNLSTRNYHYSLHNTPEERGLHLHSGGSIKWSKKKCNIISSVAVEWWAHICLMWDIPG